MLISIKWLEEILETKLKLEYLKVISLNLGLEVEKEMECAPAGLIIGGIKRITPHPRQKKLEILEIKTDHTLQIVSAAKNIKEGDLVLVGPAGIDLNGQKILEKDFNGIKSRGILISEQELKIAEKSTSVIILDKGKEGSLFKAFYDDVVIDMKTTPNRPDWLSVYGIARELSVELGNRASRLLHTDNLRELKQLNRPGKFKIRIRDVQGCPRYTARIFDDVVVDESPFWIKWRLHCMGMKGVNNVVDITNLIMLLTGQPLHPFDLDLLQGGIVVRTAHAGEEFVTLEGTILKLNRHDLVIADNKGVITLAGIIGARRAQISSNTKRVLLESAYFDPRRIAHTARRLGLSTEASMRFERGSDSWAVDYASAATVALFKRYTKAKEIEFTGIGKKAKIKKVQFSKPRLNMILSLNLSDRQIKSMLKKIGIDVTGNKVLFAKIPHYRRDLQIEEDIYEEVARIYGYMNIPETLPKRWAADISVNKNSIYEETLKNYLVGQGFMETYNLSLMSSKRLIEFSFENVVRIKNPLNERFDALRPTLFFGLLDCLNYNLSKGNKSLNIFEIGNILRSEKPFQERRLGVIIGGAQYPDFWNRGDIKRDYYDIKGIVEGIFSFFRLKDYVFKPTTKKGFNQAVTFLMSGKELGYLGGIEKDLCQEQYFYIEMALEPLWSFISMPFYIPPAKFPANTRDLSFLIDERIEIPDMIELITKVSGPVLEKINLFDYYKGDNLPSGKKSIGFRLYFRAPDRTLTDNEVDSFIKKIAGDVYQKFNAELRTKEKNWMN